MCPEIADDEAGFSSELSGKAFVETGVSHAIAVKVEEPVQGEEYPVNTIYAKSSHLKRRFASTTSPNFQAFSFVKLDVFSKNVSSFFTDPAHPTKTQG